MIKQDHQQMKWIAADKMAHLSKASFLFPYQRLLFCNLSPGVGARFSNWLASYAKKILLEISLPKGWSQWGKFSDQLHYSMTNFCHRRGAALWKAKLRALFSDTCFKSPLKPNELINGFSAIALPIKQVIKIRNVRCWHFPAKSYK